MQQQFSEMPHKPKYVIFVRQDLQYPEWKYL